jgi:hypothetical protein
MLASWFGRFGSASRFADAVREGIIGRCLFLEVAVHRGDAHHCMNMIVEVCRSI